MAGEPLAPKLTPIGSRTARVAGRAALLLGVLFVAACAAGPGSRWETGAAGPAGFFAGFWHGMLLVVSLVVSLFTKDVRIYEIANSGLGYDIGFVLGVLAAYGGGIHAGGRMRRRRSGKDELADAIGRVTRAKLRRWADEEEAKARGEDE